VTALIFLFLAGLTALGFLIQVWRRREKIPALLRSILIIGAAAIVAYVAWTISALKL
jgi:uncharacterized membrane protein